MGSNIKSDQQVYSSKKKVSVLEAFSFLFLFFIVLRKIKCDTDSGWVNDSVLFVNTVCIYNLVHPCYWQ